METGKLEKTAKPVGFDFYFASVLTLGAMIGASGIMSGEGGVAPLLIWALAFWLPAFCVDLCGTETKRFRDLTTSFLFSAALFPVLAAAGFVLGDCGLNAASNFLFLVGPPLVYGVWFGARLRRPARRETLRLYRKRLVGTSATTAIVATLVVVNCVMKNGWDGSSLVWGPVVAVYWAATVALLLVAFGNDDKTSNNAETAFDGADDGGDGDADGGDGD